MNSSPLEKILLRMLLAGLAVLVVLLGYAWWAGKQQSADRASAQAFIQDQVLPKIGTWDSAALLQISSDSFKSQNTADQMQERFKAYSALGKLIETPSVDALVNIRSTPREAYANVPLRFSNAEALLRVQLNQTPSAWQVHRLTIEKR